jgi:signal transduction histidine kinase
VCSDKTGNDSLSTFSPDSAMLKDIIELNPYGIAIFDAEGRYVESNQAYIDLFKVPPPPDFSLFNALTIRDPAIKEEIKKLAEGKTIRSQPFWHNSRDAGEQWPDNPICISGVVFPLRGDDGSIKNYIAMFEDVTTRTLAKEQLLEALRMKSHFMATISHELRTPLTGIIASIELVLRDENVFLPEKRIGNLRNALDNADSLILMINNILDMIKLEAGKTTVKTEQFPIADVIDASIKSLKSLAEAKHLPIKQKINSELPMLFSDKQKVGYIITNLISNAIKYTDSGEIVIEADIDEEDHSKMLVSVCDTGIGIPQGDLYAIFDDFKQIDSSPTRRHGGIGLGLAIVKAYVNLLGGSIEVKSERGKGSTFTVTLPVILHYRGEQPNVLKNT